MLGSVPAILRRRLRQASRDLVTTYWRSRATLAATLTEPTTTAIDSPRGQSEAVSTKLKVYHDVPAPHGYPVVGTLPMFLAAGGVQRHHEYATKRHRELGGIFRERLGGTDLLFVSDPAVVRQVFAAEGEHPKHFIPEAWTVYQKDRRVPRGIFFMDGEEWKRNRSVLNRLLLRRGCLEPHSSGLSQVADQLVDRWTSRFAGQIVPDLERQLYHWGIRSVGAVSLGNKTSFLGSSDNEHSSDLDDFSDAIHGIFKETCAMGTFPPTLAKALRLPTWTRFADCLDRALSQGRHLVAEGMRDSRLRQDRGEEAHYLLDQLLQDNVDEETVVRLLVDLFIAAADTTTHTTIWSLYLLGRHPEAVSRVRQEILNATGGSTDVQVKHLASLPYLKGVVKEALRLYPVAPFQTRAVTRDTNLGGYQVPSGTMVVLSVYTTGRDPAFFSNPDVFCPERWLRDLPSDSLAASCPHFTGRPHSHAFIPFGIGVRSCVGRRVAETQLYLLLAKLVARCDLTSVNEVDMVMRMVGVTSEPLQLRIDPIK